MGDPVSRPADRAAGTGRVRAGAVSRAPSCGVTTPPELVLLHGGAQNAHTWDTFALALDRPLIAIDLPGHGHSDSMADVFFSPADFAVAVETVVRALAPDARAVVGMSMGGLTAIALADRAPDIVPVLILVDVLPSMNKERAAPIGEFVNGPESFATFDEILARTMQFNPTRSESSLRRGILHNAVQRDDGSWVWRHQRDWAPRPVAAKDTPVDASSDPGLHVVVGFARRISRSDDPDLRHHHIEHHRRRRTRRPRSASSRHSGHCRRRRRTQHPR